jgi:hypothetical protein
MAIFKGRQMAAAEERKYRHYVHSAFKIGKDGTNIEVGENGKTKITKGENTIECSAGLINLLSKMLFAVDRNALEITITPDKVRIRQEMEDRSWDEIEFSTELLTQASKIIMTTRTVVMRDEPYRDVEDID